MMPSNYTTGRILIGLGTTVRFLGRFLGGKIGYGIAGFGLAHIILGKLAKRW